MQRRQALTRWFPPSIDLRSSLLVPGGALIALVAVALMLAHYGPAEESLAQGPPLDAATDSSSDSDAAPRLREGATLNGQLGRFRRQGGRLVFSTADGRYQLVVLENLALQRVTELEAGRLSEYEWTISGEVTEYLGDNYLLIRRATTKERLDTLPDGRPY